MRDVITANPQIRYRTVIRNYKSSLWPKKTVSQWVMHGSRGSRVTGHGSVGHGSCKVTGQLNDGSCGSRVTKRDPLSALIVSTIPQYVTDGQRDGRTTCRSNTARSA